MQPCFGFNFLIPPIALNLGDFSSYIFLKACHKGHVFGGGNLAGENLIELKALRWSLPQIEWSHDSQAYLS